MARVNFQKSDLALTNLDEIKWLGSIIHNNQIRPDQHKIDAIMKMQIPKKQEGMHRFIGVALYHRRHIKDFALIAAPLTKLLRNETEYHIGEEEKSAFEELKAQLASAPALALPNLDKPMIVTTDASDIAVGGSLSQPSDDDDKYENVVAYCSRVLTPAEQNGSLCAKELNAILYAIGYFYLYLTNRHFTLHTDSRGLIYLQSFKNPNAKLHSASAILDELSFDLQHQSATKRNLMGFADMLSRSCEGAVTIKERATYKDLKNPVYEFIKAPSYLPSIPITKQCFDGLVAPYIKDFQLKHHDQIENRKTDSICNIDP